MNQAYWTIEDLTKRYRKSKRTITRWIALPENPFPRAYIEQKGVSNLWKIEEVLAWENSFAKAA
jgi:hypothetical protein